VDSWNSSSTKTAPGQERDRRETESLWQRVMELEKSCRNPRPTLLNSYTDSTLVQLQAHSSATTFEELLNVLAS
jgi:hypothetical protein